MLTKKSLRTLSPEALEQKLRLGLASVLDRTTGSTHITVKWVDNLIAELTDYRPIVAENERRLRQPNIAGMAKRALAELQTGNVAFALRLREQVITHKRYMRSKLALPLIARFDDERSERAAELFKQAQEAARRCDVEQVAQLLEDVLALNSSMEASMDYKTLQQMLQIEKAASEALKAADEAAGELYLGLAVEKIIEAACALNGPVHSLLTNVRAEYATKRNLLMELLEHHAYEALQNSQFEEAESFAAQMLRVDEDSVVNLNLREALNQAHAA